MSRPRGEKRTADVIGVAVMVAKIATGDRNGRKIFTENYFQPPDIRAAIACADYQLSKVANLPPGGTSRAEGLRVESKW
jgi:hypothetical protein